jgi:hypothetical protein
MSTSRRTASIALVILAAAVMLAFPALGAGAGKKSTTIVIGFKLPAWHGKVTSPSKSCVGNRKVKLYRVKNGKTVMLGRDRSNSNGGWAVLIGSNIPKGSYYATVAKNAKCKGDKSAVLQVAG